MSISSKCAGGVFIACLITFIILLVCFGCGYKKWKNNLWYLQTLPTDP